MDWTSPLLNETPPIVPSSGLFAAFAPHIAALPDHAPLRKTDLLTPGFLLHRDPKLELFYAPFDFVNSHAKVMLVGIAPGWYQTEQAFRTARDALRAGVPLDEASALARRTASFSGPIRKTLVGMLDGLALNEALGIASCAQMYTDRADLLHTSAAVHYPVFVDGQNYAGYTPGLLKHPILRRFVTEALAAELHRVPDALVVPLGKSIAESLQFLVQIGAVDPARCLPGLPHPSGANVHRPAQYARVRDELAERVRAWFAAS